MFVDEIVRVGMPHDVDVGQLPEDMIFFLGDETEPVVSRVHRLAEDNASNAANRFSLDLDDAFVARTEVYARRRGVGCQLGILRVHQSLEVCVVRIAGVVIDDAPHPAATAGGQVVPYQVVVVVIGIKNPGEVELLDVGQANRVLPLAFRLGQCGKEQPGKDRDDGDHHQKLDQGKRPVRSITIACPLVEQLVVVCRYFLLGLFLISLRALAANRLPSVL